MQRKNKDELILCQSFTKRMNNLPALENKHFNSLLFNHFKKKRGGGQTLQHKPNQSTFYNPNFFFFFFF